MKLFRLFFLTMTFFLILSALLTFTPTSQTLAYSNKGKVHLEIEEIDQEITELKEMKRGYDSRAIRHENLAEMMQFESQYTLETRRHIQLAEQNREMARKVQEDIDRLEERKRHLLYRS